MRNTFDAFFCTRNKLFCKRNRLSCTRNKLSAERVAIASTFAMDGDDSIDVDEVASGNEGTLADVPLEDEGRRSSLSTSRSAAARFSAESSRSARGRGPPPPRYGVYQNFVVPREHKDSLPGLLADLDAARERLGVVDVQISLSPLEEVFLSITATH